MTSVSGPHIPSLYFEESSSLADENSHLPSELLSHCLSFCDWGDLAKLACVQSSWCSMLEDAAKHSRAAQWELAQALLHGTNGLAQNPRRALVIFRELSGLEEMDGRPVSPVDDDDDDHTSSDDSATELYAPAMRQLAHCYLTGVGVEESMPQSGMAWLQASFDHGGDVTAAHDIALIYEYGRSGIDVDVVAAFQWFEKAAQAGHVDSMAELALCYELGCGVEQNDEAALDWYTQAANLGHVTAKFSVGEAFEEARGVPQSDQEACLWYYRAALTGDEDSKRALRRLYDIARIVVPGVAQLLDE
eukprot:Nitzschia sp. Nitz4//scaffold178_size73299//36334//37245//NITZ4_005704-RA/size73299-processed-gene-0.8-mRNA-1//1//CDS//3329539137//301//frame0